VTRLLERLMHVRVYSLVDHSARTLTAQIRSPTRRAAIWRISQVVLKGGA